MQFDEKDYIFFKNEIYVKFIGSTYKKNSDGSFSLTDKQVPNVTDSTLPQLTPPIPPDDGVTVVNIFQLLSKKADIAHTQLASTILVDTSTFHNNLSVDDNTIQKVAEKIDTLISLSDGGTGIPGADGISILSIEKTDTIGLVDTYTILLSDDTTTIFTVTNGADGYSPEITWNGTTLIIDGVNGMDLKGEIGAPGADGADGAPGLPGADGADGKSAYEVAVINGFIGSEAAWLLSLVGADGADSTVEGPQGIQGVAGADGPAGIGIPVGGTAGQVLSKIDGTDYNSVWVDPATGGAAIPVQNDAPLSPVENDLWVDKDAVAAVVVGGGSAVIDWTSPVVVTDTANLTYGKHYIVAVTAADKTLTLPEITATDYGKMIVVEIAAATTRLITIDGYAAQAIDGTATRAMWAKEVAQLVATVNGWTKVGGKSIPMQFDVYNNTDQATLTVNVVTKSNLTGVVSDAASLLSGSAITVKRANSWVVAGAMYLVTTANPITVAQCKVYKNGALELYSIVYPSAAAGTVAFAGITETIACLEGTTLELYGMANAASGSFTIKGTATYTHMKGVEVLTW